MASASYFNDPPPPFALRADPFSAEEQTRHTKPKVFSPEARFPVLIFQSAKSAPRQPIPTLLRLLSPSSRSDVFAAPVPIVARYVTLAARLRCNAVLSPRYRLLYCRATHVLVLSLLLRGFTLIPNNVGAVQRGLLAEAKEKINKCHPGIIYFVPLGHVMCREQRRLPRRLPAGTLGGHWARGVTSSLAVCVLALLVNVVAALFGPLEHTRVTLDA